MFVLGGIAKYCNRTEMQSHFIVSNCEARNAYFLNWYGEEIMGYDPFEMEYLGTLVCYPWG